MDSGKSTLALQTNHNHAARGRVGRLFTSLDRAGTSRCPVVSASQHDAIEVDARLPLLALRRRRAHRTAAGSTTSSATRRSSTRATRSTSSPRSSTSSRSTCSAFGILTDFRSELFPGSARLVELADRMHVLQVEALCWCGKRATHHARTENGVMVVEGEVIVVGDVDQHRARTTARGRLRGPVPPAPPAPDDRGPRQGGLAARGAPALRLTRPGSPSRLTRSSHSLLARAGDAACHEGIPIPGVHDRRARRRPGRGHRLGVLRPQRLDHRRGRCPRQGAARVHRRL